MAKTMLFQGKSICVEPREEGIVELCFDAQISLRDMLRPEMVKRYTKTGTGEKFLVRMDGRNGVLSEQSSRYPSPGAVSGYLQCANCP